MRRPRLKPHPLSGKKFTQEERDAWDWLHARGIRPWLVDLLTKEVTTPRGTFKSLVDYARVRGMPT